MNEDEPRYPMFPDPHWERGDRCHGYWITEYVRIGQVGIGPGRGAAKKYGYSWSLDWPFEGLAKGECNTLRAAKRAVEKAFAAKRAEMRTRTYRVC